MLSFSVRVPVCADMDSLLPKGLASYDMGTNRCSHPPTPLPAKAPMEQFLSDPMPFDTVMRGFVPRIHVLLSRGESRGWPGLGLGRPGHDVSRRRVEVGQTEQIRT